MEHVYHIRYEYYDNGKSEREIARSTGHDRETVKKYISQENFNLPEPTSISARAKQISTVTKFESGSWQMRRHRENSDILLNGFMIG